MKDFDEKIMVILMFCFILAGQMNVCAQQKDKVVVGYVTSWSNHCFFCNQTIKKT